MTSNWRISEDPAAMADERYENPVPSRQYLHDHLAKRGVLISADTLASELGIKAEDARIGLTRRLHAMERDGQLLCNRAGEFGLVDKIDLIRGVVISHRDGYGFLRPDEGGEDLFLSLRTMRAVMHGDRVLVRLATDTHQQRAEAKLVEVLERNTTEVVGRFFRERGTGFVYPDRRELHQDVLIAGGSEGGAEDGQIVVARLIEQPSSRSRAVGEVVQILGEEMAPGLEIEVAIRAHGIPHEWPAQVLSEVSGYGNSISRGESPTRTDLTALPLVTIDGADAKDFDDAVYCKATPKGWRLWVAIADVASYVQPRTALDGEARARGNSTYFPGEVVPMLPEVLSNGLCSLNPDQERLSMVCEMLVNQQGEVYRSRFYEAVICSHARLTYDEVADAVQHRHVEARDALAERINDLDGLYALYHAFAGARLRRGCIEFESNETQIVFGTDRKIERLLPVVRNDAHRIIEECMIAANVCAAKFLHRHKAGGLYRVHEAPNADKLKDLRAYLAPLGLRLGGGAAPTAQHFAALSQRFDGRADARALRTMLLRSLSQARYEPRMLGHFGLGLEQYAHFTSPIRRYPDLVVHRAIKHALKAADAAPWTPETEQLAEIAANCSRTERRSDDAGRDVTAWLKCEYMLDKLGESFNGTITAVVGFGLFVELDEILVDGLVHISGLGTDYFKFDPAQQKLVGERSGRAFGLGDRMRVRVARVNLDERKIDFECLDKSVSKEPQAARKSRKKSGKPKRRRG